MLGVAEVAYKTMKQFVLTQLHWHARRRLCWVAC